MKTLIIYYDNTKKNYRKITPFAQGKEFNADTRFDGNFLKLKEHLEGNNIYKTEIFGE